MKKLLFILVIFTFVGSAESLFNKKVDPDNPPKDFQEISSAISKTAAMKSKFEQKKKVKALRRPLKSSGELIFGSDKGVYWHLQKPYESIILINDKKMASIDDKGKKVTFTADEKPILYNFTRIFLSIFTGKTEELKEHFELYFEGTKNEWKIGLKPKSSRLAKVISTIVLHGKDKQIHSLTILEDNGDQTDITFSNIESPKTLSVEDAKKFDF